MEPLKRLFINLLAPRSLEFLEKTDYQTHMDKEIQKKIHRVSNITLGKDLNISRSTGIDDIPFTTYNQYKPYYEYPNDSHFMYHLSNYLTTVTSGTMGQPKKFLLPKQALEDNLRKTGLASLLLTSHDGEKVRYEMGDTMYTNTPGGNQIAALLIEIGRKANIGFIKSVPDVNISFQEKVEYFIENHENIDMAYMTVTTLLDEITPRIGPLKLKGFMTQDTSAIILKEEIKEKTGSFPKTTYGSTETLASTVPSIEHPGCFIFDYRVLYTEFLPETDKIQMEKPSITPEWETVKLEGVQRNKRYQLVASPYLTELTRYIMPDILECVAIGDSILGSEIPVFKYHSRSDRIIVLHNYTRIVVEEIIKVLKDSGVPFVDFTARKESHGARDYMRLYLELSEPMTHDDAYRRIDDTFTEYDRDWHDLKAFLKHKPLILTLIPRGSFNKYLGKRRGMSRIERIGMKEENLALLLG